MADKLGKFGPIVESMIPMVVVTVANNRQQNSASEGKADEEEYEKEEMANAKKGKGGAGGGEGEVVKRVLKPNERLRSRGKKYLKLFLLNCIYNIILCSCM